MFHNRHVQLDRPTRLFEMLLSALPSIFSERLLRWRMFHAMDSIDWIDSDLWILPVAIKLLPFHTPTSGSLYHVLYRTSVLDDSDSVEW